MTAGSTLGEDNFAGSVEVKLFTGGINNSHTITTAAGAINNQTLGVNLRHNSDIWLVFHNQVAA
jgi:hypothetical protein